MGNKNLDTYKLGVVIDGDAAKGLAALRATDAQVAKTQTGVSGLAKQFKEMFSHDTGTAKAAGEKFAGNFVAGMSGSLSNIGQTLGTMIGTAIAPGIGTAAGSVAGAAVDKALGMATGAIKDYISQGMALNIFLEKAEVHFTALAGSVDKARAHLQKMDDLEGVLGFDMRELVGASQRLEEFNIPLSKMELYLRASADAAHAFGSGVEGFQAISNALGLMTEKGELSAKMLLKLEKQGVPALKYLSEATGWNVKELKKMADAGQLSGRWASETIAKGIEIHKGGEAQRIMEQTTYGQQFRLEQNIEQTSARATRAFTYGGYKGLLKGANAVLESDQAQGLARLIDETVQKMVVGLTDAIGTAKGIAQAPAGATLQSTKIGLASSSQGGAALAAGADVVEGIYAGAMKAAPMIQKATAWIAEKFEFGLKSPEAFDIHSPSHRMAREIGAPLGEGIAKGLKDTESDLHKTMENIVKGMIDAGQAQITASIAKKQIKGTGSDLSKFQSIADSTGIPLNLLLAIGSRETNLKNILGDFRGGQYHGAGYMQVDVGTDKKFVESGAWKNSDAAIAKGAQIFLAKLNWLITHEGKTASVGGHKFVVPHLEGEMLPRTALGMYNSGLWSPYAVSKGLSPDAFTTGKNYSADVLGRAKLLAGSGGASAASAPTGTAASPVAVTATTSAPLPVKMIFGGGIDAGTTFAALEKVPTELATIAGAISAHAYEAMPSPPAKVLDFYKGAVRPGGAGKGAAGGVFGYGSSQADQRSQARSGGIPGFFSGKVFGAEDPITGEFLRGASAATQFKGVLKEVGKDAQAMLKGGFGQLAEGLGTMVENWVLLGETGPAALRKLTAQVLASAARESLVKGIMAFADGLVHLYTAPWQAPNDFAASALYFSIAGGAALIGRAVAGNSFQNGQNGGANNGQPNPWLGSEGYAANRFVSGQGQQYGGTTKIGYTMNSSAYTGGQDQNTALLQSINSKLNPVNGQQMVLATLSKNPQAVGSAVTAGLNSNNQLSLRLGQRIAA